MGAALAVAVQKVLAPIAPISRTGKIDIIWGWLGTTDLSVDGSRSNSSGVLLELRERGSKLPIALRPTGATL